MTADLFSGAKLWKGAEMHADALVWQGFGLSQTFGVEGFPNGDAYKAGTRTPNYTFAHLFLRQTVRLGGEQEDVADGPLTIAGKQDISRLTFTLGRLTPKDILDNNAYANDPHTQFMNWALMATGTWDYGEDTVGYTTGLGVELNQPSWAIRYGFFQMPREKNGFTGDDQILMWPRRGAYGPFWSSWAMAAELERRYAGGAGPGTLRAMAWVDEANMASYQAALPILLANGVGADITPARAFRHKYGFGLSWDQQVATGLGVFSRVGWNDGQEETWTFTDVNYTASLGVSVTGLAWRRPHDTFALAGAVNGASRANQRFLEAGGTDMLSGDGALSYGWEGIVETYYDVPIAGRMRGSVDYQFVVDPAFNRARGPVSVFAVRLHWQR